jgi:hypothetical protein
MADKNKTLYYLDELTDYKVADNYCDVRGWEVKDADNRTIGKVDNLLVNKEAERVVYLDVQVDKSLIEDGHETYSVPAGNGVHEFLDKDGDDHIIIPIGMATLDEENHKVICNEINYKTFTKTSRFSKGKGTSIDRVFELNVFRLYVPNDKMNDSTIEDGIFYKRKEFDNSFKERNR